MGVPGGVSSIAAGLVDAGGLVGIGAVVGLWLWGDSLEPSPAIKAKDLVRSGLDEGVLGDWSLAVELDGSGGSDEGGNCEFHVF